MPIIITFNVNLQYFISYVFANVHIIFAILLTKKILYRSICFSISNLKGKIQHFKIDFLFYFFFQFPYPPHKAFQFSTQRLLLFPLEEYYPPIFAIVIFHPMDLNRGLGGINKGRLNSIATLCINFHKEARVTRDVR